MLRTALLLITTILVGTPLSVAQDDQARPDARGARSSSAQQRLRRPFARGGTPKAPTSRLVAPPPQLTSTGPERESVAGDRRLVLPEDRSSIDSAELGALLGGSPLQATPYGGTGFLGGDYPPPGVPGLFDLTLEGTGTPWVENFLLQIPDAPPPQLVPLIVVFHQGDASHRDVLFNTEFLYEAAARGWYLLAPLGATEINFSSIDSQINTKFVLDWVLENYNVDRSRIYGVGFSMGGGNALNFAARHLDPTGGMFAAIVNHTGSVDLSDTYDKDNNAAAYMNLLFGGPPAGDDFTYRRSSTVTIDQQTGTVIPERDMVRNLLHVPIRTVIGSFDPLDYLTWQNFRMHLHLDEMGGQSEFLVVPWFTHTWNILDERGACDFLAQYSLQIPTWGRALVDRSGNYFHFDVTQAQSGKFTPFLWSIDAGANSLSLANTANLSELRLATISAGLDPSVPLELFLAAQDGDADEIVLADYSTPPSKVLRDGVATTSWTWDSTTGSLRLVETSGAYHSWRIVP